MPACDHCMLPVSDREAVLDEIDGQARIFCCHGCKGVYRLIHSEGLDEFYSKRSDWTPGPAENKNIDVSSFLENLRPAGSQIETDLIIDGIRCASCVWLNEKILNRTKGISYAQVNYATHRAKLRWNPAEIDINGVLSRIKSIGYLPKPFLPKAWEDEQKRQSRDLLIRFGTAAFFSMQLMLFSVALYAGYFQGIDEKIRFIFHIISFVLTTPVLFYSGWPIIKGSLRSLMNLTLNMDVLIAAGALSAYAYSVSQIITSGEVYFDTAAMIITLILLGRYIEAGAKGKASETIARLIQLSPREARKLEVPGGVQKPELAAGATRRMTQVSSIRPGDLLEVIPGEKIPLDGEVITGSSEADESMLTGESKPVLKIEGVPVYGGTLNLFGSFVFRVTRTGKDTVLAQIIQAVEDAQARRAPIQSLADRAVSYFVPAILVISILTFLGWLYYGSPASEAVMNAVSVLVIACPCALGLATPLAILIGTSHAASRGILIKGGDVIEKAAAVNYVILDKTGTITEGKPTLQEVIAVGLPEKEALSIAGSLEQRSEHSLGRAIVQAAGNIPPADVSDFSILPGKGVRGVIHGKKACIGSREFIENECMKLTVNAFLNDEQQKEIKEKEKAGSTTIFLCYDRMLSAAFIVADAARKEAPEAVALLWKAGLAVAMVTGDTINTAEAVAKKTGIARVKASASPLEKAEEVRRLETGGNRVLMAGDGINDAPALVQSSVGAAMGKATDIALESADMVIMRPDLRLVPLAVALSKKTFSVIRQNIFWAFFYNIIAIPLAIAGLLHPIVAAGAMAFSSLSVVANSLRARVP